MADAGRQVKYGIGKESTPGTAVAASYWINQLKFGLDPVIDHKDNESSWGVLEKVNDSTVLRQYAKGSLEAKLTDRNSGMILLGALGSVTSAANPDASGTVKDHTFNVLQDVNGQTMTLIRKDSISTMAYPGARFGNWKLDISLDDYIKYTSDVWARKGAVTTATPAYVDETEFVAKYFNVKTATNAAGLAGATAQTTVMSFMLTAEANVKADNQTGTDTPYSFSSEGYDFGFEMECRYADQTFENAYKNGTHLALQVVAKNTDVIIGTAANPGLSVTAPRIVITDWSRSDDLNAALSQKMTGTIYYSPADGYALRPVLTNTVASY